ncbi:UDP-N-acetylmuramoyl-L-alanine--D-glutamate ligase [Herbaspirillum lusitanum]|uniref:UDP-N-acetylmuramoylalanine--D-glutamate ligase n=1 Tax=Herbaspirillum lusitanum TaxID=213312 RepID=A0ABW9A9V0_9BURK
MNYSGKHVLVLGLGESGLAMARWLVHCGARVRVADTREESALAARLAALREAAPDAEVVSGQPLTPALLDDIDFVAVSPGLTPHGDLAPLTPLAAEKNIPLWGEIELFAQALAVLREEQLYQPKVLAITGTNGKTTVTSLTGMLCQRAGLSTKVAGNISPAALDVLREALIIDAEFQRQRAIDEAQAAVEAAAAAEAAAVLAAEQAQVDALAAAQAQAEAEALAAAAEIEAQAEAAKLARQQARANKAAAALIATENAPAQSSVAVAPPAQAQPDSLDAADAPAESDASKSAEPVVAADDGGQAAAPDEENLSVEGSASESPLNPVAETAQSSELEPLAEAGLETSLATPPDVIDAAEAATEVGAENIASVDAQESEAQLTSDASVSRDAAEAEQDSEAIETADAADTEAIAPAILAVEDMDAPLIAVPPPPPPVPVYRGTLPQAWVLELSSFQLHTTYSLQADAATVLNLTQDHLDWHGSMDAYAADKARIFGERTVRVLNRDDALVMRMSEPSAPLMSFGSDAPTSPESFGLIDDNAMAWLGYAFVQEEDERPEGKRRRKNQVELIPQVTQKRLMPVDALKIRGLHNAMNALAALALCRAADLPMAPLLHGLREYAGEPHRVELVSVVQDIEFYDDSKGTNVGATVAALNGLGHGGRPNRILLIAGGDGKGQDFTPLAAPLQKYGRAVFLIGRDAPAIRAAVSDQSGFGSGDSGIELIDCQTLEQAVALAAEMARAGDIVLLSPACASLDMFRNYAHRAEVFVDSVREFALSRGEVIA